MKFFQYSLAIAFSCSLTWAMETTSTKKNPSIAYEILKTHLGYDPKIITFLASYNNSSLQRFNHDEGSFGIEALSNKSITGYHHGFGDVGESGLYMANIGTFSIGYTFNFPDSVDRGTINFKEANLAQDRDCQVASDIADYINELYNPVSIVFYGLSRGGGVVMAVAGKQDNKKYVYLSDQTRNKLGALFLEAPLGNVKNVIKHKREQIIEAATTRSLEIPIVGGIINYFRGFESPSSFKSGEYLGASTDTSINYALPLFIKKYTPSAIQPQDCVETIDPKIPMMIVAAKDDEIIPPTTVEIIFNKRKNVSALATQNTEYIIFKKGGHCGVLSKNLEVALSHMHEFRKKHKIEDCNPIRTK